MKVPRYITQQSKVQLFSKMALLISFSLLSACFINYDYIPKNNKGERLLNQKVNYRFNSTPNSEDLKRLDTKAYYVQTFLGRCHNRDEMKVRAVMQFDKDGYFKKRYLHDFKFSPNKINKNDIDYGGKYKINDNNLLFEEFYPTSGGKTDYFKRVIQKGKLINDFMIIGDNQYTKVIYKKMYQLPTQPIESLREATKDCQ